MAFDGRAVFFGTAFDGIPVFVGSHLDGEPVFDATAFDATETLFSATAFDAQYTVALASCFPKTELVYTQCDSHMAIGSLKLGNKISSWDTVQQKVQYTAVTKIHESTVFELFCFNNAMKVSPFHPLMVVTHTKEGFLGMPKWKRARDINIGDCVLNLKGQPVVIKSKIYEWFDDGVEVINLSTDCGLPFIVNGCIVRANNAFDDLELLPTAPPKTMPTTQKLSA